jgi:predicted glycoside hydrolase/deacetylase ChbG (UPF0249 family)
MSSAHEESLCMARSPSAKPPSVHGPLPVRDPRERDRSSEPPARRLIVNADDYGLTTGVSAGIREAHQHGIVTTCTAMMNQRAAVAELRRAQAECPQLGLGVHLVLTAGQPLRPARSVPTLVDAAGRFPRHHEVPALLARLDSTQLRDEWRLQIETFLATGAALDHLDSHHHISYTDDKLLAVMLALAAEYRVPVRLPLAPSAASGLVGVTTPAVVATLERAGVPLGPRHPDGLIASFMREGATGEHLAHIIGALPAGDIELMTHPGYVDDELRALSSYTEPRQDELALLTAPAVRRLLAERGVALISFASLMPAA